MAGHNILINQAIDAVEAAWTASRATQSPLTGKQVRNILNRLRRVERVIAQRYHVPTSP